MNRNPLELLQQAYYAGIGAVASAVESLQDETKRQENLAQLRLDIGQLTELWAQKGRLTEAEARNLIEAFMAKQQSQSATSPPASEVKALASDIRGLIETLAAIRQDLQQEQQPPAP